MDPLRFPKRVTFPFGYVVKIVQVPPGDVRLFDEDDGPLDGAWLETERTIVVSKQLPPRRKRYIIIHELIHAFADWQHQMFLDRHATPTGDLR